MTKFVHLHVHSHYSVLDGLSHIPDLIKKATANGMYAMALTDHGNMFGMKEFFDLSAKYNDDIKKQIQDKEKSLAEAAENSKEAEVSSIAAEIEVLKGKFFKPIFGCEAYVARKTETNPEASRKVLSIRENESGYHLILLAKNETGYHNLCKIISLSWMEGFYGKPRIDRELLEQYSEGLIVASACLGGELHKKIENNDFPGAMEAARWYQKIFGEDYYIELQRHKTDKPGGDRVTYEKQMLQNESLVKIATELGIELIATNDVHFVDEEHAEAHERLICLNTGNKLSDDIRLRYTKQEWLKTPDEMAAIFPDYPEALANTVKIADKVEVYNLNRPPMMPVFDIPAEFGNEEEYKQKFTHEQLVEEFGIAEDDLLKKLGSWDRVYRIKLEADYLTMLTMKGAHMRYGDNIAPDIMERILFELSVMRNMGFPGYFLIVQDFIQAARSIGVSVGPGRGSAAGSVVAYCLKITDVDPLKYDLLFERFLNPDRVSLPDIDVDFDDEGRGRVLEWVTNKYGKERVAHIITYGTMATKMSIKDVARVQEYELASANRLVGLIPHDLPVNPENKKPYKMSVKNCVQYVPDIKEVCEHDAGAAEVMKYAAMLENTVRQTGIHACGVIIGADDLSNHAPMATIADKESKQRICVTQYEGSQVESVGLIKMDFLGLSTLSIIKETLSNIKKSRDIDLDIDAIPIDDPAVYALYQAGDTIAIFQFESPGMQKYLRELKPTRFEDLIAMNALYRPGPMDYIPQFIARKQGKEPIKYDIDIMEKYLSDTYGITVYQEQVMLLSRLLANFTRGQSDELRKAMGKKIKEKLDKLKPKFIEGGKKNGHDEAKLEKIWADWEKFASYAFNKSHATCYSWVSYQTAYLKTHYAAEFMAANLTNNLNNVEEISKLLADCKRKNIRLLSPDINESDAHFTVNKQGDIRFGLAGIKGVGEAAVEDIIKERKENGPFKSIIDVIQRVNLRSCNKRLLESMACAGAFDSLGDTHRAQFFYESNGSIFLEKLLKYANNYQQNKLSKQTSIFDTLAEEEKDDPIVFPQCPQWNSVEKCRKEYEVIGFYISGHPLDDYKLEITSFFKGATSQLKDVNTLRRMQDIPICIAGIIDNGTVSTTQKGTLMCKFSLEDTEGRQDFTLYTEKAVQYKHWCTTPNSLVAVSVKSRLRWAKNADGTNGSVKLSGDAVTDYDLRVDSIESLIDVMSTVKIIEVNVHSVVIDDAYRERVQHFIHDSKMPKAEGSILKFKIFDYQYGDFLLVSPTCVNAEKFCDLYTAQYGMDGIMLYR